MIIRGTTPYHNFVLPILAEDINELFVTYSQNESVIIEKNKEEVEITNLREVEEIEVNEETITQEKEPTSSKITVHLTQEDTLGFKFYPAAEKNIAKIQIRVLTNDGEAYASDLLKERIYGVLKEGVVGEVEEINEG